MVKDKLIEYFIELLDSLKLKKHPNENYLFYVSNNNIYIEYNGSGYILLSESKIYNVFKSNGIDNIEEITKPILENYLNMNISFISPYNVDSEFYKNLKKELIDV